MTSEQSNQLQAIYDNIILEKKDSFIWKASVVGNNSSAQEYMWQQLENPGYKYVDIVRKSAYVSFTIMFDDTEYVKDVTALEAYNIDISEVSLFILKTSNTSYANRALIHFTFHN